MKGIIVFIVIYCIIPSFGFSSNLDSVMNKVVQNYSIKDYYEYDAVFQRFDSSRTQKFQELNFYFKYHFPNYHVNFGNQLETIVYNNKYIEINHIDSDIVVGKVKDTAHKSLKQSGSLEDLLFSLKEMKIDLVVEIEDSSYMKIRMVLKDYPSYYMSLKIDKKTMLITQNQFYKGE
ncbi:MAG: hypothetical protein ACOVP5_06910, partial [Chitinophagales bacterium]